MTTHILSKDELNLMVSLVRTLNPDSYKSDEIKALLYKVRTITNGDQIIYGYRE